MSRHLLARLCVGSCVAGAAHGVESIGLLAWAVLGGSGCATSQTSEPLAATPIVLERSTVQIEGSPTPVSASWFSSQRLYG